MIVGGLVFKDLLSIRYIRLNSLDSAQIKKIKSEIRNYIWSLMEESNIALFPRPVFGRIPNFVGADKAASILASMDIFREARVIKVNPDSPQHPVRYLAIKMGKTIVMPTPKLRRGFLILYPDKVSKGIERWATSIKGALVVGERVRIERIPQIDLVVVGSVAVSRDGARVGKGGGYADLEYAILREFNKVSESVRVVTTVHDVQVIDRQIPMEPHDLPVDYIVTPSKVIETETRYSKPRGVIWDIVSDEMVELIPLLAELRDIRQRGS